MTAEELTHVLARERWGDADEWEGSVNDPRTHEEHGVRYNEKWVYLLPGDARRIVYWYRYDCRGVLIESSDGSAKPEDL